MKDQAVQIYKEAIQNNKSQCEAIAEVWKFIRGECKNLRAPDPFEALCRNGSSVRSYRSPIAEVLGIPVPEEFGRHCCKWPRTIGSLNASKQVKKEIIQWFEQQVQG